MQLFLIHFDEFFFEFSHRFNFSCRFTFHCNQVSARKKTPNVKEMLDFLFSYLSTHMVGRLVGGRAGELGVFLRISSILKKKTFILIELWKLSIFCFCVHDTYISAAFCVKSVQPPLVCRSRPVQHAVAYYERLLRFIFCKKFSKKKTLFLLHVVQSTDPVHKRGKKKLYA